MGDNSEKKKNTGLLFFMRNPYMKFQDCSLNGLKVTLCTKKCDPRTHACNSKSNMTHQLFQSWGNKYGIQVHHFSLNHDLCFEQKYDNYQDFSTGAETDCSVLDRHVFVM